MLRTGGSTIEERIAALVNGIIHEKHIPYDWNQSYIINFYKGKGYAKERGNNRGLKVIDQVLKVIERVLVPVTLD